MLRFEALLVLLLLFLVFKPSAQVVNPYDENPLPKGLTGEEVLRLHEIGRDFVPTPPPVSPVRNIAEWERNEAVLIRYPLGIPLGLVAEMANGCNVITIVADQTTENQARNAYQGAGVNLDNCTFIHAPTNSYWTRDYGPWFVSDSNNQLGIVNFIYNRPRPLDDQIPVITAGYLNIPVYGMSLVHTGGNYMTDGCNISASTDLVYTENNDNQIYVHQIMHDYLGIESYHITLDPPGSYIKHIDCWGKYLAPDKILIAEVPQSDPRYWAYEQVADYFSQQTSAYGTPYNIYRIYTPNREPYTNSLILNNKVLVPIMNSQWDAPALATYEAAMPGYQVIGFTGSWNSNDALHCRTKEIADRGLLHINHSPTLMEQPVLVEFEMNARVIPHSGAGVYQDSVLLIYRIDDAPWDTIPMQNIFDDEYNAAIPFAYSGGQVSYYIFAADSSGRRETHPFIGQYDPHVFEAGDLPGSPYDPQPNHVAIDVPVDGQLQWQFGVNTDVYTLLFGQEGQMDTLITNGVAGESGTYSFSGLASKTLYNWQVIAINSLSGLARTGPKWAFTTACTEVNLSFSESFDESAFPLCWQQTYSGSVSSNRWNVNNTHNAGGTPYEMRADWANGTGISRLILPPLNTAGFYDLQLTFRQYYQDWGSGCTIKIQSSSDGVNWSDEAWSHLSGNGNIPATITNVTINQNIGPHTLLAFVIEGNHYQYDYWYIDDVEVNGTPLIPVNLYLQNTIMPASSSDCFEATQTIEIAGDGTYFIVEGGSITEIVAGKQIVFQDGVIIESGAELHAHITITGDYCSKDELFAKATETGLPTIIMAQQHIDTGSFKLYPNPTSGPVVIKLRDIFEDTYIKIALYSMIGEKLIYYTLSNSTESQIDLTDLPSGLYIIKVTTGNNFMIQKIIKN